MMQALLGGLAQSGLPVHQRNLITPCGYPLFIHLLPDGFCSHKCISGYLISTKSGLNEGKRNNEAQPSSFPVRIFFSRSTLLDALTTSEQEANFHDHMVQGG
jgi:hypothetical protein